jgi:hypothetical protein
MPQPTCEERIDKMLASTIKDLERMYYAEDQTEFHEYGLSFDYVAPGTFNDQESGYFRYQMSWGGPSDEFRFYTDPEFNAHYIEYAFLDWYDGATRKCNKEEHQVIFDIYRDYFLACGSCHHAHQEATEAI